MAASMQHVADGVTTDWAIPFVWAVPTDVAAKIVYADGREKQLTYGVDYALAGQYLRAVVPVGSRLMIWQNAGDEEILAALKRNSGAEAARATVHEAPASVAPAPATTTEAASGSTSGLEDALARTLEVLSRMEAASEQARVNAEAKAEADIEHARNVAVRSMLAEVEAAQERLLAEIETLREDAAAAQKTLARSASQADASVARSMEAYNEAVELMVDRGRSISVLSEGAGSNAERAATAAASAESIARAVGLAADSSSADAAGAARSATEAAASARDAAASATKAAGHERNAAAAATRADDAARRSAASAAVGDEKASLAHVYAGSAWRSMWHASIAASADRPGVSIIHPSLVDSPTIAFLPGLYVANPEYVHAPSPFMGVWPVDDEADAVWDAMFFLGPAYPDTITPPPSPLPPPADDTPGGDGGGGTTTPTPTPGGTSQKGPISWRPCDHIV